MTDPAIDAARAIDALRRGWPVTIDGADGTITLLAIETADEIRLSGFDPHARADVLLSAERAATLKLANQAAAATPGLPVLVERAPWLDLAAAIALADPSADLAHPLQGPYRARPVAARAAAAAGLELARLAGLLPAFFAGEGEGEGIVRIAAGAVAAFQSPAALAIVARARLPIAAREAAEIVAFRGPADAGEHIALIVGEPDGRPPLVRLHSECLTGDVLGSLKCDCGPQLRTALEAIAAGWGILLYLRQEGRGIGLVNKLRAYALQDQGFDTIDANLRLGFAIDARDFAVAARMLELLRQPRVRLLTNNPAKVAGLEAAGIAVVERVPLAPAPNPHNARYLDVKRERSGHLL